MTEQNASPAPVEPRRTSLVGNVLRGALIGVVETVPGVSGGTVALVVGIYHQLIHSAAEVVSAGRRLVSGPDRIAGAREHLAAVHWRIILPLLIGMPPAVFTLAGPMADAIENHPEMTRAAFFGMVLASLLVPLRMAWRGPGPAHHSTAHARLGMRHGFAFLAAAALTFWIVSLPAAQVEPGAATLIPAAAVAVSALLLPGLSGSYLLLTVGLYEPTMRAVSELDLTYLGPFALGMVLGVILIVKGLKWLLDHRHTITMVVLAGVMLGAMRTLWPWQTEERSLLAPAEGWPAELGIAVAGFAVVLALVLIDARLAARQPSTR